MKDAPADVAALWITVKEISAKSCEGSWHDVAGSGTFNLLDLQNGVTGVLAAAQSLPAADYCELRLRLADDAHIAFVNTQEVTVKIPSGGSSGLKLKGNFAVVPGHSTRVVIDFDVDKSLVAAGGGKKYLLKPVLNIVGVSYVTEGTPTPAGSFEGWSMFTVTPETSGSFDLGGGATITFAPGSVDAPVTFSASRWSPPTKDALSHVFHFSPSYQFIVPPTLAVPLRQSLPGASVTADRYEAFATSIASLPPVATALVSHFSDYQGCRAFVDVNTQDWFYTPILNLACYEIIKGYEQEKAFHPDATITRAELLKLVVEVAVGDGIGPPQAAPPFTDVTDQHWAYDYIAWAHEHHLISGYDGTTLFRPDDPVNWAEAAKLFVEGATVAAGGLAQPEYADLHSRYLRRYLPEDGAVGDVVADDEFADVRWQNCTDGGACWYYPYVYALRDFGALHRDGSLSSNFEPAALITRADAAYLTYILYSKYQNLKRRLFCKDPSDIVACDGIVDSIRLTQPYLRYDVANPTPMHMHAGVDLAGDSNGVPNKVYSPASGSVVDVTEECGRVVISDDADSSTRHVLLHMTDIVVDVGDAIVTGDHIGTMSDKSADCGIAHGVHLHYEIRRNYENVSAVGDLSCSNCNPSTLTFDPFDY